MGFTPLLVLLSLTIYCCKRHIPTTVLRKIANNNELFLLVGDIELNLKVYLVRTPTTAYIQYQTKQNEHKNN